MQRLLEGCEMAASSHNSDILSAQVILKPESLSDAALATEIFRSAGFEVGHFLGNSFSITGPRAAFERQFKIRLPLEPHRRVQSAIRLQSLPASVRDKLEAVVFTRYEPFA
jgi:hypothetical protein